MGGSGGRDRDRGYGGGRDVEEVAVDLTAVVAETAMEAEDVTAMEAEEITEVVEVDVMTMTIAVETETEVTTVVTTIELGTNSQVLPKLNIAICDLFCASDIK